MKRTIAAILVLSPVLLFAQTNAPAQPSSTPVLQSSVRQPVAVAALHPLASAAATTTTPTHISTGVVAPRLVQAADIELQPNAPVAPFVKHSVVRVHLTVDVNGKPTQVAIEKSPLSLINDDIVRAVSKFRYEPGQLDGVAFPVPVTLDVTIQ